MKNDIVKSRKKVPDKLSVEWFPREFRNLRQLPRNFGARKILFKNVSRHIRILVT